MNNRGVRLKIDGIEYSSIREACRAYGLQSSDSQLRRLIRSGMSPVDAFLERIKGMRPTDYVAGSSLASKYNNLIRRRLESR